MLTLLRTVLLITAGWYLLKWLVRWVTSGSGSSGGRSSTEKDPYGELTDQKIDDADYEDL
jgi:hypothetical protein